MRVLIICRKKNGKIAPFITEQVESLRLLGIECAYFPIEQNGVKGYLSSFSLLKQAIKHFCPDVIHAHYGLSGLFATLQRHVPVVTTFHGSDIHTFWVRFFSKAAIRRSSFNVFVSQQLMDRVSQIHRAVVIPCGVDLSLFYPVSKAEARSSLGWNQNAVYLLFAGDPNDSVKNYALAQHAVAQLDNATLIPLAGYARVDVRLLMNGVDAVLMTSFHEGSPQVIKEAMACNCPVVSTNVGDVSTMVEGVEGCFLTSFQVEDVVENLGKVIQFSISKGRTQGRDKIMQLGLDLSSIAQKIRNVYQDVMQES
ncbi:MAG: glycosyltransferase [Microbacter sp.]